MQILSCFCLVFWMGFHQIRQGAPKQYFQIFNASLISLFNEQAVFLGALHRTVKALHCFLKQFLFAARKRPYVNFPVLFAEKARSHCPYMTGHKFHRCETRSGRCGMLHQQKNTQIPRHFFTFSFFPPPLDLSSFLYAESLLFGVRTVALA